MMPRIRCWLFGHRWIEQKPHRLWQLNRHTCTRCGKTKIEGIFT